MDSGEKMRETVVKVLFPSPPSLVANAVVWTVQQVFVLQWFSKLDEYARTQMPASFREQLPRLPPQASPQQALAAIDETLAFLGETVQAMESGG